ncbi:hypothetical protein KCG44_05880 [Pacificimonas sp. WHA3]|uniref:Uncharacterized protein n=1 Tax=Pacificimonas pallii TaxID=2827236 RepID=A0ABS6SD18_9SPHN|nr:hypothetical protein [Pacificimonas pallii]MBV7256313.1 hypothetical protein [Pacificimonas pallii]
MNRSTISLAFAAFMVNPAMAQLDAAARPFINRGRASRLNGDDLVASGLFLCYAEDVGGRDKVVADALSFANDRTRALVSGRRKWDETDDDWDLNDAR